MNLARPGTAAVLIHDRADAPTAPIDPSRFHCAVHLDRVPDQFTAAGTARSTHGWDLTLGTASALAVIDDRPAVRVNLFAVHVTAPGGRPPLTVLTRAPKFLPSADLPTTAVHVRLGAIFPHPGARPSTEIDQDAWARVERLHAFVTEDLIVCGARNPALRDALEWVEFPDWTTAAAWWSGPSVPEHRAWSFHQAGLTPAQAHRWHRVGCLASVAREFDDRGWVPDQFESLYQAIETTVDPDDWQALQDRYEAWLDAVRSTHLSPAMVLAAARAGFAPDALPALTAENHDAVATLAALRMPNPPETAANRTVA